MDYAVNETVTGGTSGNTGVVISWDSSRGLLRLKNVSEDAFTGHETMTGALSTTTGLMAKSDTATSTLMLLPYLLLKVDMFQKMDIYQKQQ